MNIFLQSNKVSNFPLFNYEAIILLLLFPHDVINIFLRRLLGSNSSIQHQQQNNHLKCHYEFVFLCLNSLFILFHALEKHHRVLKMLIFVDNINEKDLPNPCFIVYIKSNKNFLIKHYNYFQGVRN